MGWNCGSLTSEQILLATRLDLGAQGYWEAPEGIGMKMKCQGYGTGWGAWREEQRGVSGFADDLGMENERVGQVQMFSEPLV